MKVVGETDAIQIAEEDIRRAQWGKDALENPLVKEYLQTSRQAMLDRIEKTSPSDFKERELIYFELQQLTRFKNNFNKAMTAGKVAETFLQRLAKQTKSILKR